MELNPNQKGNLNLKVSPKRDVEAGKYTVEINLEGNGEVYSESVEIVVKDENKFVKNLKETVEFYRYYLYLLLAALALVIAFNKQLRNFFGKIRKKHEKYRLKREKLLAKKIAKKEMEEEKRNESERKKEDKAEELAKKERDRRKETKKEEKKISENSIQKSKKTNKLISLRRVWLLTVIFLVVLTGLIFAGHQAKLFNAKYLHVYIGNIFVGYLYYILIGVGTVAVLFLLVSGYNLVKREKKPKRAKVKAKAEKKAETSISDKTSSSEDEMKSGKSDIDNKKEKKEVEKKEKSE